jgi:hypothetical protein
VAGLARKQGLDQCPLLIREFVAPHLKLPHEPSDAELLTAEPEIAQGECPQNLVLSCELSGIKVAYLDTQRDLGVVFEVFNGLPDDKQKPDAT